jgi:hypothetical protein
VKSSSWPRPIPILASANLISQRKLKLGQDKDRRGLSPASSTGFVLPNGEFENASVSLNSNAQSPALFSI